jgi:hypothetical protein
MNVIPGYTKVSNKWYKRVRHNDIEEIKNAEAITIPGFEKFDFCRVKNNKSDYASIIEGITGCGFFCCTKHTRLAQENEVAKELTYHNIDAEKILISIQITLQAYGCTPRYKKESERSNILIHAGNLDDELEEELE